MNLALLTALVLTGVSISGILGGEFFLFLNSALIESSLNDAVLVWNFSFLLDSVLLFGVSVVLIILFSDVL